jgi:prepilin-type N-terminal cleavage/methylation domain-containing protein
MGASKRELISTVTGLCAALALIAVLAVGIVAEFTPRFAPAAVGTTLPASPRPAGYAESLLAIGAIRPRGKRAGFTLIELSIVLVIIGLIVGGVLVGQSLISAAEVRAQITQIEKYNSAVNTFRGKFNAIPGDMNAATAQQYGFAIGSGCNGSIGRRDGNGLLDGASISTLDQGQGETTLFWQDLSNTGTGNFIDGTFPNSGAAAVGCISSLALSLTQGTSYLGDYYPVGKIGHATFIYVYENNGVNWYGLSAATSVSNVSGALSSNVTLPVIQAYNMDSKVDDGLPGSGNVQAIYINGQNAVPPANAPNTTTSGGTSSSCYDTTTSTYSITVNNGNGGNCALSFKFQ